MNKYRWMKPEETQEFIDLMEEIERMNAFNGLVFTDEICEWTDMEPIEPIVTSGMVYQVQGVYVWDYADEDE